MALTIGGKRRKPGGGPPATPLTPTENRLVRRLVTVMNLLSSSMDTDAYAAAIADLDPDRLERLLADVNIQQLGRLLDDVMRSVVMEGGMAEAREIIRTTPRVQQSPFSTLEYPGRVLSSGIIVPESVAPVPDVEFVIEQPVDRMFRSVSERATNYARTRSAQLVTSIDQSNRLAIREVISQAFTGPRTVDQTARSLRNVVGLHPRWARAVQNFNDKNFRRLIKDGYSTEKAQETADAMTEKYRRKLIRRRAEMIARTEVQQAQNFGREASWQASERAGLVDPRAEKEWRTAPLGSRYGPPCEECSSLRGTRVPWNGSFANGYSMPPAHPNCRCTAVLVPPTRGLTGLPSQGMDDWIARLDALEAEDAAGDLALAKHLGGQHDQKTHGRGGRRVDSAEQARKAQETGEGSFGLTDRDALGRMMADPASHGLDDQGFLIAYDATRRKELKQDMAEKMFMMNSDEKREAITSHMEEIRSNGKVMIATTPVAAQSIIEDGVFKSQFETETSGGAVDPTTRAAEETASLDIHPQVYAEKRPIYGYVAYGEGIATNEAVRQYGSIRFELKDSVKDRTTMLDGDSLGSRGTPVPMRGEPLTQLQALGATNGWRGTMAANSDLGTLDAVKAGYDYGSYIEAQVKSGVSLDDVARVYIPRVQGERMDALRGAFGDLGIEVVDYE